jgi:DNA-binding transcriptional MerR regulator
MSGDYPWDELVPESGDSDAAQPPPESPVQMELDAVPAAAESTSQPSSPAAEHGAEPPNVPAVTQPDGDPRRREQAELPAAVPPPAKEGAAARPHGDSPRAPARERPVARKEYYSIGEVSELAGLPAHVLRYWESQFPVLNPSKNRSGNRAYQRKEIKLILLVKHLLYDEKYTVEGAKAKLDQLRRGGTLAEHTARALDAQTLALLREDVARLRELLSSPPS